VSEDPHFSCGSAKRWPWPVYVTSLILDYVSAALGCLAARIAGDDWPTAGPDRPFAGARSNYPECGAAGRSSLRSMTYPVLTSMLRLTEGCWQERYRRGRERRSTRGPGLTRWPRWRGAAAACWRKYSAMCGTLRARDRPSREPDLFRGIADFRALASNHEIDGAADLGTDAPGRRRYGRRWGFERRKGARLAGGFSMGCTICARPFRGNAPQTSRFPECPLHRVQGARWYRFGRRARECGQGS
jgi:hypothetical protein